MTISEFISICLGLNIGLELSMSYTTSDFNHELIASNKRKKKREKERC